MSVFRKLLAGTGDHDGDAAHPDNPQAGHGVSDFSFEQLVKESYEQTHSFDKDAEDPGAAGANKAEADLDTGNEIITQTLDELVLPPDVIQTSQESWAHFLQAAGSKDQAGEAIYSAIFEGAPSLQTLFVTPRAIQAVRFLNGLHGLIGALGDPGHLKIAVETLGFGHLNLDVTVPRVVIFRDAILDLFDVELAQEFTPLARQGWKSLLNYVGGAIIFVKAHYADRLRTLDASWAAVNKKAGNGLTGTQNDQASDSSDDIKIQMENDALKTEHQRQRSTGWRSLFMFARMRKNDSQGAASAGHAHNGTKGADTNGNHKGQMNQAQVPTTFHEMFLFNQAVMGFSKQTWMNVVLSCFDDILTNVSNSARLQDECNVLVIRIANFVKGSSSQTVNLTEFKSCMLASLRSLLPKAWDSQHEVAWSWLWENVERLLKKTMGNPPIWQKKLIKLLGKFDSTELFELRAEVYARFFVAAPAGQDFFKQSNTYLHVIADRILDMTKDIFEDPSKMVDEISALGLRHVGYAIPLELFGPFVTACIEVMSEKTTDEVEIEAFRWSLGLICNLLVRTIAEGSTIVMKAIDANNAKQVRKAIGGAPRAERSKWLLVVQVGTQSISPLSWAITCGCMEAAGAIVEDLLTIRADRERYYYGVDDLFGIHPDFINRLIHDAPSLLPMLWKNLVWRCKTQENRMRRVNFYIKHLTIDKDGSPSPSLLWLTQYGDPKTMEEPIIVLLSDLLWHKVVFWRFAMRKAWYVMSVTVFMASQVIVPKLSDSQEDNNRMIVFVGRCINYGIIMVRLICLHIPRIVNAYRRHDTTRLSERNFILRRIRLPSYLADPYDATSFALMWLLGAMCASEPMFWCWAVEEPGDPEFPTELCNEAKHVRQRYTVFCMAAMFIQWFLISDLAIFSTQLSAFMLIVKHVLGELNRFLVALSFLLATFGSAISVLQHDQEEMQTIVQSVIALYAITVKLYQDDYRGVEDPWLVVVIFIYQGAVTILLLNLLIAQLQCSFEFVNRDARGFARLSRAVVLAESIATTPKQKWNQFVDGLRFDVRLEFNEGDVGMSGGIQLLEPGRLHPIVGDTIQRFGGSCSPDQPWPEEHDAHEEENKLDKMERLLQKVIKKMVMADNTGSGSKGIRSKDRSSDDKNGSGLSDGSSSSASSVE